MVPPMTAPEPQKDAGRALDIEVQRVVFGATRFYCRNGKWWDESQVKHESDRAFYVPSGQPWHRPHVEACPVPRYSQDIRSAWTVVERMREMGFEVIIGTEPGGWQVEICVTSDLYEQGYRGVYSRVGPAPQVICEAAVFAFTDPRRAAFGAPDAQ